MDELEVSLLRIAVAFCAGVWITAVFSVQSSWAQQPDTVRVMKIGDTYKPIDDSSTIYHMGAVIVGTRLRQVKSVNTFQRISLASLEQLDAVKASDLGPLIPSGLVQTNSRGESLLYLRNTGERQLALFFDGALLNIPWDNRVDLDLIPVAALGAMSVSKGAASATYGANVLGGAVNMMTRTLADPGSFSELELQAGNAGHVEAAATHLGRDGAFQYVASVGYLTQDGMPLSGDANLPYNQTDSDIRTNTDLRRFNAFGRAAYTLDGGPTVAFSASYIDAEKGIAPESHKNPEESSSIRYWRYPDWRNALLIASVAQEPTDERQTGYRGALWFNRFDQTIMSYDSVEYQTSNLRQDDGDNTAGGRFVIRHEIAASEVRVSVNGTYSSHDQVEESAVERIEQSFGQLLGSAGVEADIRPGGSVSYTVGLSVDAQSITDADVFETPDANMEMGGIAGAVFQATSNWLVRGSVGRKSRFPTMRELFAGALGRFVVNPNLSSETGWLGELGVGYLKGGTSFEVVGFSNLMDGTIDQDVIEVDGEVKRIRVNLGGSRSLGIEMNASARPVLGLVLQMNGMLNYLRARATDEGEYDRRLTERPNALFSAIGTYSHKSGATGGLSVVYRGEAYSLDDDGEYVPLDPSVSLNLRVGYRLHLGRERSAAVEFFGRVDNAFDVVIENQLGLPGPGRSMIAGLKFGR